MLPPALRFGQVPTVPTSLAGGQLGAAGAALAAGLVAAEQAGAVSAAVSSPISSDNKAPPILDPLAMHKKLMKAGTPGAIPDGLALMAGGGVPPAPSLYEMAALTHELDTQVVTTKVKEVLLANNVGQKVQSCAIRKAMGGKM